MHKHFTWMSLWTCWYATALNGTSEKNFRSSVVPTLCALSTASPSSSQTVDERESAFSFSLTVKCGLFEGVGISSIEVVGETVLAVLTSETMGVAEVIEVTDGPFPVTHSLLSDVGQWLVLLGPHLCIHTLVELGRHFYKKKTLGKKKKIQVYARGSILTSLILTLFSFNVDAA